MEMEKKTNQGSTLSEAKLALLNKWKKGDSQIHNIQQSNRNGLLPLSFSQQRLWFLEQLIPGTPVYNISGAVHIKGELEVPLLETALDTIIQRHESLRTRFVVKDAIQTQEILSTASILLPVLDISQYPENEKAREMIRILEEEARCPFDLTRAPLIRAKLIVLSEKDWVLSVTMHHIVSDGWSLGILNHEMTQIYDSYAKNKAFPLKELQIQYADFALWQKERMKSPPLQKQMDYWKNKLKNLETNSILSYDKPRPSIPSYQGKRCRFEIDGPLAAKLKNLGTGSGLSLYMVLLAALKILMYRYSGQKDINIGCPIANRNHQQIEDLIGFFVNTLVMRSCINPDESVMEYLKQIKNVTLEAYANQDIPFERLVEILHPNRDLSVASPLFQVAFVFQNTPFQEAELDKITVTAIDVFNGMSPFDLLLSLTESQGKLKGFFEYAVDLYHDETIEHLVSHFQQLLISMADHADMPVKKLNLLSIDEKNQILEWGRKKSNFPSNDCVHVRFEKAAEQFPNNIALSCEDRFMTYQELNEKANQLARYLISIGVVRGALVGIYMDRSLDMIISILAILKAGGAYVPIDPAYPMQRIEYIADDTRMTALLIQNHLRDKVPQTAIQTVSVDTITDQLSTYSSNNITGKSEKEDLAYVIYTSGSTGMPKGVLVEHENVVRLFDATYDWFQFNPQDIWTMFHSHAFDFSVWEIWGALLYGGKLVIVPYIISRSPELFHGLLKKEKVTYLSQTPSAFRQLLQVDELKDHRDLSHLKYIVFGGEALELHTLRPWFYRHEGQKVQLINMYGITETTVHVTFRPINKEDLDSKGSLIGIPVPDLSLYLLDENQELVPMGLPGEIYVGGSGVARGYLERPELTKERFIEDPFTPNSRLYKSGDSARLTYKGELEFLGRLDHQVKIRGFRLELGEIEAILKQHEQIKDVYVMVRDDAMNNKQLIAYLIQKQDQSEEKSIQDDKLVAEQWQKVFNQTYDSKKNVQAADFNITGWNSLYDGKPIPGEEMKEWVEATVRQILDAGPKKVLEIGCGTGLLLFKLIQVCEEYLGTDISSSSIQYLNPHIQNTKLVQVQEQPADDFTGIKSSHYDIAVINSVIQYFPSIHYLVTVIKNMLEAISDHGTLFIGDVRSLSLLPVFYQSVEIFQCRTPLSHDELKKRVQQRVQKDHELIIDPRFFLALQKCFPQIVNVEIRIKPGHYMNELTRFRYDVVLQTGKPGKQEDISTIYWSNSHTIEMIKEYLVNNHPEALIIISVPNARLAGYLDNVNQNSVDPMRFYQLENIGNYKITLLWAGPHQEACFNVLIKKDEINITVPSTLYGVTLDDLTENWSQYSNTPYRETKTQYLSLELRNFLKERIPEYMVPSSFILLNEFPLTSNGKIDREALPMPNKERMELGTEYVAPRNSLEKSISEIWSNVLGILKIGVKDSFFELGGHSLLATQLIFSLRDNLGIEIPLRVLFETPTIEWMARTIENKENGILNEAINLRKEVQLKITPRKQDLYSQNTYPIQNALLTGATGFLGAFLLKDLMTRTEAAVYCLVRANDKESGLIRLQKNLSAYGLWEPDYIKRIEAIPGDLAKPGFGLSKNEWEGLSETIDTIYHNGSMVNFIAPYIEHHAANVQGTHEILNLVNSGKFKTAHYISTTHVFTNQDFNNGLIKEDDVPSHPEMLTMGYTQSKWVADQIFSKAMEQGMPVSIYRPGRIWGDSKTGQCQAKDFLWLILKTSIEIGSIPAIDTEVDIIPVNYASTAIVELSKINRIIHPVFHLVNPVYSSWKDIIAGITAFGYNLELTSLDKWRDRVFEAAEKYQNQAASSLVPLFTSGWDDGAGRNMKVDCTNVVTHLSDKNIFCPSLNQELMKTYLAFFINSGNLPAPYENKNN